jgi:hypothetical protein
MKRALLAVLAVATVSLASAQNITFEELGVQPSGFANTNPLTNQYAPAVTFAGPNPLDGGAVLNQSGNFGVNAHSGEHFLAFNKAASMQNGGVATDPETLTFGSAMTDVSIWAAGGFNTDSFQMQAFNAANQLIDTDSLSTQDWAQLSVSGIGITKVVLTQTGDSAWVYDDLTFVPEPASLALLILGVAAMGVRR